MNWEDPFGLIDASSATERMDGLGRLIETWLGPRDDSYGWPAGTLNAALPMPLARLHEFAGKWPASEGRQMWRAQDILLDVDVEPASDGRVRFIEENQGSGWLVTSPHGDDPPVWSAGYLHGTADNPRLVNDSLSQCLAAFIARELAFSSARCVVDVGMARKLLKAPDAQRVLPVTKYVSDTGRWEAWLWNDVLAVGSAPRFCFAANSAAGLAHIEAHQGAVFAFRLTLVLPPRERPVRVPPRMWLLHVEDDGTGRLELTDHPTDCRVSLPDGTFDFAADWQQARASVSDAALNGPSISLSWLRRGQSGEAICGHAMDQAVAIELFSRAIEAAGIERVELRKQFGEDAELCEEQS